MLPKDALEDFERYLNRKKEDVHPTDIVSINGESIGEETLYECALQLLKTFRRVKYDPILYQKSADGAVIKIMHDLNDRSGFDLDGLDDEILLEMQQTWIKIIEKELYGD